MTFKLPFKSAPKAHETVVVGDESIGSLEIRKIGDLSVNERIYIRDNMKDVPDLRVEAVKVAKAIALKNGKKVTDMFAALTTGDTEALGDNLEELVSFQNLMEFSAQQRQLVMTTAVLRYRVCPDWTLQDTGNPEQISPKLVEAVYEFTSKEENGWAEPTEADPVTEEDLGKSSNQETAIAA